MRLEVSLMLPGWTGWKTKALSPLVFRETTGVDNRSIVNLYMPKQRSLFLSMIRKVTSSFLFLPKTSQWMKSNTDSLPILVWYMHQRMWVVLYWPGTHLRRLPLIFESIIWEGRRSVPGREKGMNSMMTSPWCWMIHWRVFVIILILIRTSR